MKFRNVFLPLLAAALTVPGVVRAQDDGNDRPGMIGVAFNVNVTQSSEHPEPVRVVRVGHVLPGSPAEAAGVRAGDVVVRIDGHPAIDQFDKLHLQAGETVVLGLRRDGAEHDVSIVAVPRTPEMAARARLPRRGGGVEERVIVMGPDSMPLQAITMRIDSLQRRLMELNSGEIRVQMDSLIRIFSDSASEFVERIPTLELRMHGLDENDQPFMVESGVVDLRDPGALLAERPFFMELGRRAAAGAELAEMNDGLRRYFPNVQAGALVIDVGPETPAARAGLQAGDVIVRAGGDAVSGPEDVRRALMGAEQGSVALEVIRQGRGRQLTLQWDGHVRVIRREIGPVHVRTREPRD